jgi:hypothetical protein
MSSRPLVIVLVVFLLPALAPMNAAPAPDKLRTAREKLTAIKEALPAVMKEWGEENNYKTDFERKVKLCRMIAPDRAKLVIQVSVWTVSFTLTYYEAVWTVVSHDSFPVVILESLVEKMVVALCAAQVVVSDKVP